MIVAPGSAAAVSPWRHVRAIVLLPLMNVAVIPAAIVLAAGSAGAATAPHGRAADVLRLAAGGALLAGGLALAAGTIMIFVRRGRGTLAPWDPPRVFVVAGPYRRCRHPMKLGLFSILLGETLLLASVPLLCWLVAFAAVNVVYIAVSEEPALHRRFGRRYGEYCRHVPRWLPRWAPWTAGGEAPGSAGVSARGRA